MSATETSSAQAGERNGVRPEPRMLPQWAFEGFRPVCRTICRLLWRIRFLGAENIPRTGGLIIAANHQTYIDPFWVAIPIKRPLRYLAWDEAFSWPVAGRLMVWLGAWPVQLEGCDPAPIRRSLKFLRDGGAVMIFPEGGRGLPDGSMVRFKPGAARMALEADVPILPVTICGGHRVWPKDQIFPHPAPVTITYHPLLRIAPQPGEDARQCARRETARLAEIIRSAL